MGAYVNHPQRIVCLTEETTETLYLLGEEDRIVGISGFTVRPPQARREKPKVSAFTSAKLDKIAALEPDLVLGFSDLQADIAAELVKHGIEVHIFNHRTVDGILSMIVTLGAIIGCPHKANQLADRFASRLRQMQKQAATLKSHPRIYFEEWDDPMISGIGWVAELVRIAGGIDVFPELAQGKLAKGRIVQHFDDVIRRRPDIIIGSWCGKKFRPERVAARPGFTSIPAVQSDDLYEIKSSIILQPGPAALTDGLDALHTIIRDWAVRH